MNVSAKKPNLINQVSIISLGFQSWAGLIGLLKEGRPVYTGIAIVTPSIDLDGEINISVRVDKCILDEISWHFVAEIWWYIYVHESIKGTLQRAPTLMWAAFAPTTSSDPGEAVDAGFTRPDPGTTVKFLVTASDRPGGSSQAEESLDLVMLLT